MVRSKGREYHERRKKEAMKVDENARQVVSDGAKEMTCVVGDRVRSI